MVLKGEEAENQVNWNWSETHGIMLINHTKGIYNTRGTCSALRFRIKRCDATVGFNASLNVHELENSWKESEVTWKKRTKEEAWNSAGGDYGPTLATKEFNKSGTVIFSNQAIFFEPKFKVLKFYAAAGARTRVTGYFPAFFFFVFNQLFS